MSLITKSPSFSHCTSNYSGTAASTLGTNLTAVANDVNGSSVAAITAITHDVELLVVMAHNFVIAASNTSTLLDILTDPNGGTSWLATPLINDLLVGQTFTVGASIAVPVVYYFPIWIPSGSSIGIRAQTAHTANVTAGRVIMHAYGGNANPGSWWCGQSVQTVGADDTISQGTNHTAGTSSNFSTWTNFGTTASSYVSAVQYAVQGTNTDVTQAAASYCFEFGVSSTRVGPPLYRGTNTTESGWTMPTGPIFVSLPSGTQMMVRAACGGTTPEAIDVAAYLVM